MTKQWYESLPDSVESRNRRKQPREPKGKGWITFMNILDKSKKGEVTLRRMIRKEITDGKMIAFEGTQRSVINGRLQRQVWYKKVSQV
jgi:hypothetical protein